MMLIRCRKYIISLLIICSSFFLISPVFATIWVSDPIALGFAKAAAIAYLQSGQIALRLNRQLPAIVQSIEKIKTEIDETNRLIQQDGIALKEWLDSTYPTDQRYKNAIKPLLNDLESSEQAMSKALDPLEIKGFNNDKIQATKGTYYGQGVNTYIDKIKDGSMCPGESKSVISTYADLQYVSCNVAHNARAYKQVLTVEALKQREIINNMINAVTALPAATVGEHDAKKTVLLEIEELQRTVKEKYYNKIQQADMSIKMAEDSRKYAAESIVVGPPTVSLKRAMVQGVKMGVAAAITVGSGALSATVVPYQ